MPSAITDFLLPNQSAKMHPDIGVASNYVDESNWNASRSNPFKRAITINNTGKSVKSNYPISFRIDTKTTQAANQCTPTCSDFRVYDSDETTELDFWVEGPNTSYTVVFVKIPSLPAASKTIYLYYGNPALKNKANIVNTCGSVFTSTNLKAHLKANDANRVYGGGRTDSELVWFWSNRANEVNPGIQPLNYPSIFENQVNGLPAMRFNGGSHSYSFRKSMIGVNSAYEIFIVEARTSNKSSSYLIGDNGGSGTNDELIIGYNNDTTFNFSQRTNSITYTVPGYTTKTWRMWNLIHDKSNVAGLGGGGHYIRLNGATVASNTNTTGLNTANINRVGVGLDDTGFYQGDIAEIIVISTAASTTSRTNIENYLNAKYRLYNTSDMPTITVGSQTSSGSTNWVYQSYAPFSTWNFDQKLEKKFYGIGEVSGTATIQKMLTKTLFCGDSLEGWTNSTLDSSGKLSMQDSRTRTATTSSSPDSVVIERLDGVNNLADLSKFDVSNLIEPSATYLSTDLDWIDVDFYCTNHSLIDLTNSYIQFENSAGTLTYKVAFNQNINPLESNRPIILKFPKSSFTKTGTGTWANASYRFKIDVRVTSGSQSVNYGYGRLTKNYTDDPQLAIGNHIRLRTCISSDEDTTYYNQTATAGVIVKKYISRDDVVIDYQDYLTSVLDKNLSDLPSFPSNFICWVTSFELNPADPDYKKTYYTYFLKKVLSLIFPVSMLDINLDMEALANEPPNLNFVVLYSTDKIRDVINRFLEPVLGWLAFDSVSGKYVARSGYKFWDKTNYGWGGVQLDTAYTVPQMLTYEFKDDSSDNDLTYNYLKLTALYDAGRVTSFAGGPFSIIGFSDGSYELAPSTQTTIYFENERLLRNRIDCFPLGNLRIDGFNCSTDPSSSTFGNTGISVVSVGMVGNQVYATFKNTNSTERYLRTMNMQGDFVAFYFVQNFLSGSEVFEFDSLDKEVLNQDSIDKYGKKEIKILSKYGYYAIATDATLDVADLYNTFMAKFSEGKKQTQLEVQYIPDLRVGKVVTARDNDSRIITGHVLGQTVHCNPDDYVNSISVREVS